MDIATSSLQRQILQYEAALALAAEDSLAWIGIGEGLIGPQLFINCNDVFGPATADAEPVPWGEVIEVKHIYDTEGWDGVEVWVRKRRSVGQ